MGRQQTIKGVSVGDTQPTGDDLLIVGQGLEELLIHTSLEEAELRPKAGIERHQLGNGLGMASEHNAVARGDPSQQS